MIRRICETQPMHRPVLSFALVTLFYFSAAAAQISPAPPADVLIVHDSAPSTAPAGLIDGNNVIDLLGHFGLKGHLISVQEYKPGECSHYRYMIVLGVDDRSMPYP